jgi:hypothetical protein
MVPRLLVACFALAIVGSVVAQSNDSDGRPRSILTKEIALKPIEAEPVSLPATKIEDRAPLTLLAETPLLSLFRTALTSAMEAHVGAHYHYGSIGPDTFDCSGFVWSSFQEAGVTFQRGPARSYWAQFQPVSDTEKFKFGTLVFFSGLAHVGIVVDEHGFYHSSRHHGVIYSPFNDYWLSRIDGFRRVPLNAAQLTKVDNRPPRLAPSIAVEER